MNPSDTQLRALLRGALDTASQEELEDQLASDPALRKRLDTLAGAASFHTDFDPATLPPEDSQGINRLIKKLQTEGVEDPTATHRALTSDTLEPSDVPGSKGRLGDYEIEEVIATGGMGVIYRARDPALKRSVAIKLLSPALAASPEARVRFLREAAGMAAIDHPNILPIYAIEKEAEAPYIVMRLVEGQSLQKRIDEAGGKPLPLPEIVEIAGAIAAGLTAAHTAGLIHRDVKPSNILLEASDALGHSSNVFLSDFGLARAAEEPGLTRTGTFLGTPQYMSPEQAGGESDLDQRTDLFSFGAVLYTMATGTPPFEGETFNALVQTIQETAPRPPRQHNPALPGWLANLIVRLLAKKPSDRPESAAEVADTITKETNLGTISTRFLLGRRTRLALLLKRIALATSIVSAIAAAAFLFTEQTGRTAIVNAFSCYRTGNAFYRAGAWGTYPDLQAAIDAAEPGDTLIVRSRGDRASQPTKLGPGKPLTIRAASGYRPVLASTYGNVTTFLTAQSPLRLEGITFRQVGPDRDPEPILRIESSPVTLINCKLVRGGGNIRAGEKAPEQALLYLHNCPSATLINSEVYVFHATGVHCEIDKALPSFDFEIRNNQLRFDRISFRIKPPTAINLEFEQNVMLVDTAASFLSGSLPAHIDITANRNIIQAVHELLAIPVPGAEELHALLDWRGQENIYFVSHAFARRFEGGGPGPDGAIVRGNLSQWREFWTTGELSATPESGSMHYRKSGVKQDKNLMQPTDETPVIGLMDGIFDGEELPPAGPDRALLGAGRAYDTFRKSGAISL